MTVLYKVPIIKWSSRSKDGGDEQYARTYSFGKDFKVDLDFTKNRLMDRGFPRRYADKLQLSEEVLDGKQYKKWEYEGQPVVYVAEDGFYIDEEVDLNMKKAELAKRLHHVYRCFSVLNEAGFILGRKRNG